jgi:diguanylate cyclase (GGDEF)-like protein
MDRHQVLIIDDDKETAALFSAVLSMVGFHCETVYSAREALYRLSLNAPDLVLLDLRLGLEIGGEEILYQIRGNPRYDKTSVIVITAYPDIADLVTDMADLILLKPVEVDQLRTLVTRIGTFEIKSKHIPFRDPVTQLYNQDFFPTRLELAFERARRRPDFRYAVIALQIQPAPDQVGPIGPDLEVSLLREVADRLRHNLRPTDTIARYAGWRFLALTEELKDPQDLQVIVNRLREKLEAPYLVESESYRLKTSFGGAVQYPGFARPGDILAASEHALEQAIAAKQPAVLVVDSE